MMKKFLSSLVVVMLLFMGNPLFLQKSDAFYDPPCSHEYTMTNYNSYYHTWKCIRCGHVRFESHSISYYRGAYRCDWCSYIKTQYPGPSNPRGSALFN